MKLLAASTPPTPPAASPSSFAPSDAQPSPSPVEHNQDDPNDRQADADDEQKPRIGGGPLRVDEECHHRRHEAGDDQEPGEGLLHVRPQCAGNAARVANPTAARRSWPRWSSIREISGDGRVIGSKRTDPAA